MTERMYGIVHKYHVVKADAPEHTDLNDVEHFVLKKGDILAIAALRSYSHNITTILDMYNIGLVHLSGEEVTSLVALADDTLELASIWENDPDVTQKLPD